VSEDPSLRELMGKHSVWIWGFHWNGEI
jgi:hypothetical protein